MPAGPRRRLGRCGRLAAILRERLEAFADDVLGSLQRATSVARERACAGEPLRIGVIQPPPVAAGGAAADFEVRVPPSGELTLVPAGQRVAVNPGLAGRTLTVWADQRSIHLLLDGHVLRTVASRLGPADLAFLTMRGARPAGPAPAVTALPHRNGTPQWGAGQAVEVDRKVHREGHVVIAGSTCQVGFGLPAAPSSCAWTGT